MRVAHVNDLAYVGSESVRALRALGIEAELVEPARPGAGIPPPWKLGTLPLRAAGLLAAGIHLRRGGFDLVHVHYARLGLLGPLSGRPYILHCHGTDVRGVTPRSAWGREVGPFFRGAACVYYATPDLRPWVEAFRPDAAFIANPIPAIAPETLALAPDRDLLVGARLSPVKGLDSILGILRAVIASRPTTTVTLVEEGPGVALTRKVAGASVRVVPYLRHAAMPSLFRAHRVVLGQQAVGALGNYELEAMAAAVPVAAAFRHPEAYSSPPPVLGGSAPEDVAERILALLDDEAARVALGRSSADWVAQHHDPATLAARLIADYREVVGSV